MHTVHGQGHNVLFTTFLDVPLDVFVSSFLKVVAKLLPWVRVVTKLSKVAT